MDADQQQSLTGDSVSETELEYSRQSRRKNTNDDGNLKCPECGHTTFWVAGPVGKKVSLDEQMNIDDVYTEQPMDITERRCADCGHTF
ncbi:hypothetical protein [Salinibaculum rarum]|uniref:hypothetical protein n=1 Tax=Salinibaculum rarum TaxID=3058903 RepID=UPI00265F6D42|nr:hypothetical protein [Salinibaculum sp. KK48]